MDILSNMNECNQLFLKNKKYTFAGIFFYFVIYSFFGWILENVYSLLRTGVFFKQSFLYGALKPMYGLAVVILLLYKEENIHWALFALLCLIIPTAIEYAAGWMLYNIYDYPFWDYSHLRYNIHGYICLQFSLYWLLISELTIYFLHPYIKKLYNKVSLLWGNMYILFLSIFLVDIVITSWFYFKLKI